MQKLIKKIVKTLVIPSSIMFGGMGCSQEFTESITPVSELNVSLKDSGKFALAKEILKASEDPQFRELIWAESGKKFDGDYNFLLSELNKKSPYSRKFNLNERLLNLIEENQNLESGLQIFIPFHNEKVKSRMNSSSSEVILVFQELNEAIKEVDGYKLIENELVILDQKISEEFAKTNEVWVLGYNERLGDSNIISIDRENARTIGAGEYLYQAQIPDISAIEHWTAGALELTLRVATQKSGDALVYHYGDISRGDFKDQKWKTFNTFIANWTFTAIGDYIKVHWTERDGGGGSVKITLTMPSSENVPFESKVEFTITSDDDNLGHQMVQFTDLTSQIYSTGLISWKMSSL